MAITESTLSLIGRTPLVELSGYVRELGLPARIAVKLEGANPFGSVKDRVAFAMLRAARDDGRLGPGSVIIEPTSGNTGIGLAGVGAVLGYRVILTMPDTMSVERRQLLAAHGAELVLTPGAEGMKGAIARAGEIAAATPGSFMPGQFDNPANVLAHYTGTGPEIWEQTDGGVDAFVAGVGTGGTVTGVGRYLKERNAQVRVVAVEPDESPVLSGGKPGPHGIQGIGAGFVPAILDTTVYDEIQRIPADEARAAARAVARHDGLLLGVSSGAAIAAAVRMAKLPEYAGKTIVAMAPDFGERYLSLGLFDR